MMLCVFGFSDQNRALRALGTRGESERIADGLQERDEGFRNSRADAGVNQDRQKVGM